MSEIAIVAFMFSILSLALLAVEVKRVLVGIVLLCTMNALIGVFFWLLHSPFVAMFMVFLYVGALAALFLTTASLVGRGAVIDVTGRARLLGGVVSLLVAGILLYTLFTEPFPIYTPTDPSKFIVPEVSSVISAVSVFLWSERSPDLFAKALTLVSAIACCIYILGKRGK